MVNMRRRHGAAFKANLVVPFAHYDQPISRALFSEPTKWIASPLFFLPSAPQPSAVAYLLDYLEDKLRFPASKEKIDALSVDVTHEPVVVSRRIRADQEFNLRKILAQVVMDFPHQAEVERIEGPHSRDETEKKPSPSSCHRLSYCEIISDLKYHHCTASLRMTLSYWI